jgi:hypothetical protein
MLQMLQSWLVLVVLLQLPRHHRGMHLSFGGHPQHTAFRCGGRGSLRSLGAAALQLLRFLYGSLLRHASPESDVNLGTTKTPNSTKSTVHFGSFWFILVHFLVAQVVLELFAWGCVAAGETRDDWGPSSATAFDHAEVCI